jgi:ABC-2 type transport system permease protein
MSIRRIFGVMLRYFYSFTHNLDKWIDTFYWPFFDIIVWGITISAIQKTNASGQIPIAMIISGIILWYVIVRSYSEISISILEEFWNENLINFLATPLKLSEWITALLLTSISRLAITFIFTSIVASLFYATNILYLQWHLIPMIISLMMVGWSAALFVASLIFRYGTRLQSLAWAGIILLMPFSATFFPLNVLPIWAQKIATLIPSSYVFETMRSLLFNHTIEWKLILKSLAINIIYFSLAIYCFYRSFKKAKEKGISHLK